MGRISFNGAVERFFVHTQLDLRVRVFGMSGIIDRPPESLSIWNIILYIIDNNYQVTNLFSSLYWSFTVTFKELDNSHSSQFLYNIYNHEKYFQGEPVNIHIQSLINII